MCELLWLISGLQAGLALPMSCTRFRKCTQHAKPHAAPKMKSTLNQISGCNSPPIRGRLKSQFESTNVIRLTGVFFSSARLLIFLSSLASHVSVVIYLRDQSDLSQRQAKTFPLNVNGQQMGMNTKALLLFHSPFLISLSNLLILQCLKGYSKRL